MLLIQLSALSKFSGPRCLLNQIDLSVSKGERCALIGENGSGKTTLLQLLAGALVPDSGSIHKKASLQMSYVPQEIPSAASPLRTFLLEGPLAEFERRLCALVDHLDDPEHLRVWSILHEEFDARGGYRRPPTEDIDLDRSLSTLSSGQRMRAALAKALIEAPDLLLLDEPTNHLDHATKNWLLTQLSHFPGAIILASHDRSFLNATCNRLIEIKNGRLTTYGGHYDFYLSEKEKRLAAALRAYEDQKEEKKLLKAKISSLTFARRKTFAPRDSNIMAYDHRGGKHQKSLQRTLRELNHRLALLENNPLSHPAPKNASFPFRPPPLVSHIAIEMREVTFGTLFSPFTRTVYKGDRILLQGPNGSGKTTLLRLILSLLTPTAGYIYLNSSARIGYLPQEMAPHPRLSPGERKRDHLLTLLKTNILLLDEPTNHLDLATLEAFETALLSFEGAIIAVSHDPTFTEKIATDIWTLP